MSRRSRRAERRIRHPNQPTLLGGAAPGAEILTDEVFGPVLTVQTFASEAEAIALANSNPYGLAATLFTGDKARAERVSARLVAGTGDSPGIRDGLWPARPERPGPREESHGSAADVPDPQRELDHDQRPGPAGAGPLGL